MAEGILIALGNGRIDKAYKLLAQKFREGVKTVKSVPTQR